MGVTVIYILIDVLDHLHDDLKIKSPLIGKQLTDTYILKYDWYKCIFMNEWILLFFGVIILLYTDQKHLTNDFHIPTPSCSMKSML